MNKMSKEEIHWALDHLRKAIIAPTYHEKDISVIITRADVLNAAIGRYWEFCGGLKEELIRLNSLVLMIVSRQETAINKVKTLYAQLEDDNRILAIEKGNLMRSLRDSQDAEMRSETALNAFTELHENLNDNFLVGLLKEQMVVIKSLADKLREVGK